MASPERLKKLTRVAGQRQQGIVVLEDILDPHNAQAVMRSCEVFGIGKVALIQKTGSRFNPDTDGWRASCTANKWVDSLIFYSTAECFEFLKENGFVSYATVVEPRESEDADHLTSIFTADLTQHIKTALVFGNERKGLSREAISLSDYQLTIPRQGLIESLNLSVSAAIFLFELNRQRAGAAKFLLEDQEREELLELWARNKKTEDLS